MTEATIRLDRSRTYSECRGERTPQDPHYRVHFWQGGKMNYNGKPITVLLPFDVHGELVPDDGKSELITIIIEGKPEYFAPLYSPIMRAYLEAKTKKAEAQAQQKNETIIEETNPANVDGIADDEDEVNLVAWLKGQAKYPFFQLRAAAKKRYHKNYGTNSELVTDLVLDEKILPEDEVCPELAVHLKALNKTGATI